MSAAALTTGASAGAPPLVSYVYTRCVYRMFVYNICMYVNMYTYIHIHSYICLYIYKYICTENRREHWSAPTGERSYIRYLLYIACMFIFEEMTAAALETGERAGAPPQVIKIYYM